MLYGRSARGIKMNNDELYLLLIRNLKNYKVYSAFIDNEKLVKESLYELIHNSIDESNSNRMKVLGLLNDYETISNYLLISITLGTLDTLGSLESNIIKNEQILQDYTFEEIKDEFNDFFEHISNKLSGMRFLDSQNVRIELDTYKATVYFSYIVDCIQVFSEKKIKDDGIHITIMLMLMIAGILTINGSIDRAKFYKLCNLVIQVFNKNELYQDARNLSEEILCLSINENIAIYGCYVQLTCFTRQKNIQDSLFYYICIFSKIAKENIDEEIWFDVIESVQIIFRDNSLDDYQDKVYRKINSVYGKYFDDRRYLQLNLTNMASKFSCKKLSSHDLEVFLDSNREKILGLGIEGIIVWYVFTYQVNEKQNTESLHEYLNYFNRVLPNDTIQNINALLCNNTDIITRYNELYQRLDKTLYHKDMVSEIKNSEYFLRRMIVLSETYNNKKHYLNAFRLLVDLSSWKKEKNVTGLVRNEFSTDIEPVNHYEDFVLKWDNKRDIEAILLCRGDSSVYQLNIFIDKDSYPIKISKYNYESIRRVMSILFDITHFNPNPESDTDIVPSTTQIEAFKIFELYTLKKKPICILADIDLVEYPSNLYCNNDEFIFLKVPLFSPTNIESFLSEKAEPILLDNCHLWCPADSGDITLNLLFSKIETIIDINKINANKQIEISNTFSGDIRIVIAHGGSDIDHSEVLSATDNFAGKKYTYENIENILIGAKLVILFVCYSGKVSNDYFYNKNNSLIKKLLSMGVSAVIAPKWPLNIFIPPIWLPVFFEELKSGKDTLHSFHNASLKVYERYRNCGAWACLHYFGNTSLKIDI